MKVRSKITGHTDHGIHRDLKRIVLYRVIAAFLFISALLPASAQLCTGSLGDPVIDIDFGAGSSTHGPALGTNYTNYTYSSANFPIDGSYTIENTTTGASNVWWGTTDHTGNTGGYMMVINASVSVTDYFYKDTITGLCPNTTYEFAAWVMNLLIGEDLSPPDLVFSIQATDGTVLNADTTGSIPITTSPTWKQFGFYFTTGANVSTVVVFIRDISGGGAPANDLALDDITFRPCGPVTTATVNGSNKISICAGSGTTVSLQGNVSGGYASPVYQWQIDTAGTWQNIAGANSISASVNINTPDRSGIYQFRLLVGNNSNSPECGVVSDIDTVELQGPPSATYSLASVACVSQSVQFIDSDTSSSYTYHWTFGDGTTDSGAAPVHTYSQTGTYTTGLIVSSAIGCADTVYPGLIVQVYDTPHAAFDVTPVDTTIFMPEVTLTDLSTGYVTCRVYWGDGEDTDCTDRTHIYQDAGVYSIMLVVANAAGCTDTAYDTIIRSPEFRFYVPNAFTPNGDGINDVFIPGSIGVYDYDMKIFDRWGEKVFESNDVKQGWDGYYRSTLQSAGLYVYTISLYDEVSHGPHLYYGSLTLIR